MRSGNLVHRVKFYPKVTARDSFGASVDTYPIATIATRGEIRYSGGSKTISNEEIFFSKSMELTIRYRSDIVESMRVQIDSKKDLYFINGIPEVIGRNEALRLPLEKINDGLSDVIINAPSELVAAFVTDQMALTWLNNADDDAVLIERSEDCASWIQIKRTLKAVESYSDTTIEENTRYFYRIRHIVYSDYSAYSNVADDVSGSWIFAGSPSNLILTASEDDPEITLDWTIGSINYDGHSIERSLDGVEWEVIDTVAAGIDTYIDVFAESPEEEILYYYRIRAYKDDSYSNYTDIESVLLKPSAIPQNFQVVLIDPDGVDEQSALISWDKSLTKETEIFISIDSGAYTLLTTVAPNIDSYVHEYIIGENHSYDYKIRFKEDLTVLDAPIIASVTLVGSALRVVWDDNNTEAEYIEIWASIDSGVYNLITTIEDGVETYDHTVAFNSTVDYKLRAKEGTLPVYSDYSEISNYTISFDSDAITYFDAVVSNGGSISIQYKILISDFIEGRKSNGLWSKDKAIYLWFNGKEMGAVNLKSPSSNKMTKTGNGSESNLVWSNGANGGVQATSAATNVGYDTNFNPTSEGMAAGNIRFYWFTKTKVGSGVIFGDSSTYNILGDSATPMGACSGGLKVISGSPTMLSHNCIDNDSGTWRFYDNNTEKTSSAGANTLYNGNVFVMCLKNAGVAYSSCRDKLQIFGISQHFTAQNRTDDRSLIDSLLSGL